MKSLKALAMPFAFVAGIAGISAAVAATVSMQDVNLKVSQLTAPFNKVDSVMEFAFTALNIDAEKTLDFGFTGLVAKKGTMNEAKLEFKKAQYTYGDGTKPTVDLDLQLDFDIVKAFGQETINEVASGLDKIVLDAANGYAQEFGTAGKISATIEDKVVDAQGNVESITMKLSAAVDFAQLPATKPANEVEFQSLDVVVTAGKTGFVLKLNVVVNPLYKGFDKSGDGLKEYIEKILNDDQATYDELNRYLAMLDGLATMLVEMKP